VLGDDPGVMRAVHPLFAERERIAAFTFRFLSRPPDLLGDKHTKELAENNFTLCAIFISSSPTRDDYPNHGLVSPAAPTSRAFEQHDRLRTKV